MRILMLNYEFPPLGAGGSTSSFNLARNVVALGHEVDVVTMGFRGIPNEETMDGIRVSRVPSIRARREVCHTHEMATYVLSGTARRPIWRSSTSTISATPTSSSRPARSPTRYGGCVACRTC